MSELYAPAEETPHEGEGELYATVKGFVTGQKLFGRYALEKVLGRGGMGIVWLARDERLNRFIALKVLPEEFFYDPNARDDLKHETRKSLELTHPNIVRIHDFVEDDKGVAISMEFVDGATLSQLRLQSENKVLESDALAPWVESVCQALHYAHESAHLVHRDLKPANIMVNRKGVVKITDFGIACSLRNSMSRVSIRQSSSGTMVYMSPEQMMGEAASPLDDIYSLGATIYEVMTSKPPFYSGDIAAQVSRKAPVSMMERRRELDIEARQIPKAWEDTIAKCLAKDKSKRPQNMTEMMRMLGMTGQGGGMNFPATAKPKLNAFPAARQGTGGPAIVKAAKMAVVAFAVVGVIFIVSSFFSMPDTTSSLASQPKPAIAAPARQIAVPAPANASPAPGRTISAVAGEPAATPAAAMAPDKQFLSTAENNGRLEISSNPPGLHYKIFAGQLSAETDANAPEVKPVGEGTTPAHLEDIAKGIVTVVFSRPGWEDQIKEINVGTGQGEVGAEFRGGIISITSTPGGSEVLLDGELAGITPLRIETTPGEHEVSATYKTKLEQTENVSVVAGQECKVSLKFGTVSHKHHAIPKPPQSEWQKIQNSLKKLFSPDKKKTTNHR